MTDQVKTLKELTDKEIADAIRNYAGQTVIAKVHTIPLPAESFPINAIQAFLGKGMQRMFNDAVGSKGLFPTVESKVDHAKKHVDDFMRGVVTQRQAGVGAVTSIARGLALKALKAMYAKEGKDFAAHEAKSADDQVAILDKMIAANESLVDDAKVEVERRAEAAKVRVAQKAEQDKKLAGLDLGGIEI